MRARPSTGILLLRMVRRRRVIGLGAVILVIILTVAATAPWLSSHDPLALNVPERLQGPRPTHLFGTDELGETFEPGAVRRQAVATRGHAVTILATVLGS